MRTLSISMAAVAALALSSTFASTQAATRTGVTSSTPPRLSTTGVKHRSATAKKHGANAYGFCPPGQRKKPGSGSAFHC